MELEVKAAVHHKLAASGRKATFAALRLVMGQHRGDDPTTASKSRSKWWWHLMAPQPYA